MLITILFVKLLRRCINLCMTFLKTDIHDFTLNTFYAILELSYFVAPINCLKYYDMLFASFSKSLYDINSKDVIVVQYDLNNVILTLQLHVPKCLTFCFPVHIVCGLAFQCLYHLFFHSLLYNQDSDIWSPL